MKVIVCGAGQVGSNIARYLATENNDVTVIDQSPELIQKISDTLDVQAMVGFASHPDVLEQAGAAEADMIIAVTLADEVNMVACQVAHSLFNVPTKIARSAIKAIWRRSGPTCSPASTCRSTSSSRRRSRSPAPSPAGFRCPALST